MSNNKQSSSVEWLINQALAWSKEIGTGCHYMKFPSEALEQAKEMEKEQIGYTKADVIKAGEMGEINYLDTLHIATYLDEAKKFNETYGGNKCQETK